MTKGSNKPTPCSISGCGRVAPRRPEWHSPERLIVNVCTFHAVTIWRQVQLTSHKTALVDDLLMLNRAIEVETKSTVQRTKASREMIYFVTLNGLIKVGWSAQLRQRLRSYGPSVEILCHYPGTRKDETELHQILTPFRAKGREWYTDSPMIRDLIAEKIKLHGEPNIRPEWTEPKAVVKPKRWAA